MNNYLVSESDGKWIVRAESEQEAVDKVWDTLIVPFNRYCEENGDKDYITTKGSLEVQSLDELYEEGAHDIYNIASGELSCSTGRKELTVTLGQHIQRGHVFSYAIWDGNITPIQGIVYAPDETEANKRVVEAYLERGYDKSELIDITFCKLGKNYWCLNSPNVLEITY